MAKQEALCTHAIFDNFDLAADGSRDVWMAPSVQTTDELLPQITSARTCHDRDIVILAQSAAGIKPSQLAGPIGQLRAKHGRATPATQLQSEASL